MKKKVLLFLLIVFSGILYSKACLADMIATSLPFTDSRIITVIVYFLINIAVEVLFGWLIFFRNNRKALFVVVVLNLISQPIATYVLFKTLDSQIDFDPMFLIEMGVILFETIVYRFAIIGTSFKKALVVSFALNFLSYYIGQFLFIFLLFIGSIINNIGKEASRF